MFGEMIKKFFSETSEGKQLTKAIDLLTLPLISQFRYFQFSGLADNNFLTPNFSVADIQGRMIVIKGIKIVPYYDVAAVDLFLTDGVTTNAETIPGNTRINRIFDVYDYGVQLSIFLNGGLISMFPTEVLIAPPAADGNVSIDLDIDNIYYKFPAKLTDFQIRVDGQIVNDIENNVIDIPNVKVFVQCYIF